MESNNLNVDGAEVRIKTGSSAEAREIGAMYEHQLTRQGENADDWLDRRLDDLGRLADVAGRPKFVFLAWALAIVGSVVAYISWSRLSIDDTVAWLFGVVGVAFILGVKFSAGMWAEAKNKGNKDQARFFSTICLIGLLVDMLAGAAFQAALSADEATGTADVNRQIVALEREVRDLTFEIGNMTVSPEESKVLQFDLDRELGRQAMNLAGEPTKLSVGEVIGFGTDDYCLPGGNYASYIDIYCPDVIDLHRAVKLREDYEAKVKSRLEKTTKVADLIRSRPKASSGLALGSQMADANSPWQRYLPGMLLMLIIISGMVVAAFAAKRHPKGVVAIEEPPT